MKFLVMQLSSSSCQFLPLRPKYSPQYHILKHPVQVHVRAKSANRFGTLAVALKTFSAHSEYDWVCSTCVASLLQEIYRETNNPETWNSSATRGSSYQEKHAFPLSPSLHQDQKTEVNVRNGTLSGGNQ
jgi:hypothetical protein